VPPTLRCRIYKKILYSEITQKRADNFVNLTDSVNKWESAIDDILLTDIHFQCNDDKYFIFQDMIEQCLLPFFRDKQILDLMKSKPQAPVMVNNGTQGDK